mgnify:CR=1 FL=1|tara:strand:- start:48 stop:500 length:453 start_codon:yes stop_codon:yes gene_type:complete
MVEKRIEEASYEVGEMFSRVKDIAHYPNYPHSVTFTTVNDEEFLWTEDEEEATKQAKEQMQNLFDDIGITAWNQDFIESIVPDDYVDFVDPAFKSVMENNDYTLSKSNAWLPFLDEIFEESLRADGVGHTLSGYDGNEISLESGLLYRLN